MSTQYKPNILIVGPSGSGKSSSLEHLPVENTVIIDLERKGLPYRPKGHKVIACEQLGDMAKAREEALNNPTVQYVVIESFTKYTEMLLMFCRGSYKGYDIYSNYNAAIRRMLDVTKSTSKIVVWTGIDELVEVASADGSKRNVQRLKVGGKEHEGSVEKEFLIVLYTDVKKDEKGKMHYRFMTNTDGLNSAKTPRGMFSEQYIPNDLMLVIDALENYYKVS